MKFSYTGIIEGRENNMKIILCIVLVVIILDVISIAGGGEK